jgi:urease accessory protein
MIRATALLPAGGWDRAQECDNIELPHDGRHRRRVMMRSAGDTVFLLDLTEAALLKDGDGLRLEDGRFIRVVAAKEPILEITGEAHLLSRLAWHLGNRHVPAEILAKAIRIAPDHVLEDMLKKLGAKVAHIEAPFNPEAGAYASEHAHGHVHDHDHHHEHNEHMHTHKHGHGQ